MEKTIPAAPLLAVMEDRGLTLIRLAAQMEEAGFGSKFPSLSAWANGGAYNPTAETLHALAVTLGCDVADIMPERTAP